MGVTTTNNKPFNPRGNDQSPKGYNRASLFSGKALDFDGVNDQITFGTISDLTFGTGDFTAVLDWQIDSVSTYSWAIAKNPSTDFGIGINNTGGLLRLWIGGTLSLGTENILGSDWKKIAVVRESGVVSAYINGVAISLTETAMAGSIDSGDLFVGSWVSNADFWNGLLNNIRIFNTALTAEQVADLYNNPEKVVPTGLESNLKLWLPMMEGAGTTAYNGAPDALGSELVTNGTFDTDSDWTLASGSTIGGGSLNIVSAPYNANTRQTISLTSGKTYIVNINATATGSSNDNTFQLGFGDSAGNPSSATQHEFAPGTSTKSLFITASATDATIVFRSRDAGTSDLSVHSVSVKEITGVGTINGATWTHGIGAPVAQTAVINWNKVSDGTNEVLIPQGLTAGRDLLGNLFENVRKQGALNLDENSRASVHENASIDISDCSLEAWVCLLPSSSSGWKTIFSKVSQANLQIYLDGNDKLGHYNSTSAGGVLYNTAFNENEWNHFICVEDGSDVRTYVNGVLQSTKTISLQMDSDGDFSIGSKPDILADEIAAQIAQPRIYNRALTAEEVQRSYDSNKNIYTNS
jgi:hypothetical protein